jgi:hypothetical protein
VPDSLIAKAWNESAFAQSAAIHRGTAPLRIALAPLPCKVLPQTEAGSHTQISRFTPAMGWLSSFRQKSVKIPLPQTI